MLPRLVVGELFRTGLESLTYNAEVTGRIFLHRPGETFETLPFETSRGFFALFRFYPGYRRH